MKICIVIILLLTLTGCSTSVARQTTKEVAATPQPPDQMPSVQEQPTPITIAGTLGVIVLGDHNGKDDFIRIYNQDGSLWHRFSFYYDDSDGDYEYAKEDFRPFAFHVDYFLLVLTCVGKDKSRYEVVVNKETGLKKYINVDDAAIKFESWEEHVLGEVFNISFDKNENPLLKAPNGEPIDSNLFSPQSFPVSAVEIKGEWLRVKWSNTNPIRDQEPMYDTAWIRWKNDGKLVIKLDYLC